MAEFDKEKVYRLQVYVTGTHMLTETAVLGDRIDREIEEHKTIYPGFKKILIFDADTKGRNLCNVFSPGCVLSLCKAKQNQ